MYHRVEIKTNAKPPKVSTLTGNGFDFDNLKKRISGYTNANFENEAGSPDKNFSDFIQRQSNVAVTANKFELHKEQYNYKSDFQPSEHEYVENEYENGDQALSHNTKMYEH